MDKNKVIEGAAKLVAKGAYDKAIKEYQRILDVEPKDVRVLQKMGELYQKKNDNQEAAKYFTRVAESYAGDGFFLKAVALYKQVLKLNPDLLDVNLKLADLHQQLGLMSEATAYFQVVANHYEKQGDLRSSLDTLKKMVDLDPENVSSRTKLAELYARERMNKEAAAEFRRVAEYLKRNNRGDDYLRIAERLSSLEPDNVELAKELAHSYLQRADPKRALAKLQVSFKANPRAVDTLRMLAEAFTALGQSPKALSVFKELAKVHAEEGRGQDAQNAWDRVAALDPRDPELLARRSVGRPAPADMPTRAGEPARPVPAPPAAPGRAPAPAPSGPPPSPASSGGLRKDQLGKLLTETDVYVKYGLHDKALEHLRRIFQVEPENLDAHEKAYKIYQLAKQPAQAAEQLLNVLRLCTRRNEVEKAQAYLNTLLEQDPKNAELPAFLAVLRPSGGDADDYSDTQELAAEDAILVDASEEDVVVSEAPEDALAARRVRGQGRDPRQSVPMPVADDEPLSLGDEPLTEGGEQPLEAAILDEEVPEELVAEPAFDDEGEVALEGEVISDAGLDGEPLSLDGDGLGDGSGDFDERTMVGTLPPLDEGEDAALVMENDAALDVHRTVTDAALELAALSLPIGTSNDEEPVEAPPEDEDDPLAAELEEASFFLDQGLTDEATEVLETVLIARPGHPLAQELLARAQALKGRGQGAHASFASHAPPSAMDVPPSVRPVEAGDNEPTQEKDAFDLAAELADELGEFAAEAPPPPSSSGDDFQYSVEEVFTEFKKGLEKVVKPEDVETHYDLGIAYKEMGLVDDAMGEFAVARQGCTGKKKEIDCLTMTALLEGERGNWKGAIEALKQAAGSEHATGDTAKALGYELGKAYASSQAPGKALYHFLRVQQLDGGYRDVGIQVQQLSGTTRPEEDPVSAKRATAAPKTRKVGYL